MTARIDQTMKPVFLILGVMATFGSLTFTAAAEPTSSRRLFMMTSRSQTQSDPRSQGLAEAAKLDREVIKLYHEGKLDEAILRARQVLKIREKLLTPDDALLADSAGNVAMVYLAKRKFDDAESFLKRALSIYERKPADNALILAKTLENLGHVRNSRGDSKKAEESYLRALSIKEKAFASNHDEILLSLSNLADFYDRGKQALKAISLMQRIIPIKEQKSGSSSQELGRLLERMSCLMHNNNQKAEAETVEVRANHILYGAQAGGTKPISLTNEVFACKLIVNPRPELWLKRGFTGGEIKMAVAVEADEAGNITSVRYIGGDPVYKEIAEKAAINAKLRPTIVDGRAVRVEGVINYQFVIAERPL